MYGLGGSEGGFAGVFLLVLLLGLLMGLAVWTALTAIVGIRLSRLCRAAGVGRPGLSYLPVLAETRVARLAGASPWWNVLALIPLANVAWAVLVYVWTYRIARAGGRRAWWGLSLAGAAVPLALAAVPDLPDAVGYLAYPSLAAIVVGRWMVFDPAAAARLGLDSRAAAPADAAPAEPAAATGPTAPGGPEAPAAP